MTGSKEERMYSHETRMNKQLAHQLGQTLPSERKEGPKTIQEALKG